jgi:hypothetical protein
MLSLCSCALTTVGTPMLGMFSVSNLGLSGDEDDLNILGIFASFDEEDFRMNSWLLSIESC